MRIALFSPKWDRPCALCVEWVYTEAGTVRRLPNGEPCPRGRVPTPCRSCDKVPEWAKADGAKSEDELRALAHEFTPENRKALARFREYRATGNFPDDPIVTWYSGIIGAIFEEWNRVPMERATAAALALIPYLMIQAKRR